MRRLLVLVFALAWIGSTGAARAQEVGQRVIITSRQAPIRVQGKPAYQLYRGRVFTVREIRDGWISFASGKPGEIEAKHVIPVDQAVKHFTAAIGRAPDDATNHYARGRAYLDLEQFDKAVADFDEAVRLDPKFARAFNYRGNAWLDQEQTQKAVADYDEAIRQDPNYAVPYLNRGLVRKQQGDVDQAIEDYTQAIRLDPDFALAYSNRAFAWRAKNDPLKAIADLTAALRIDPKDWQLWARRGLELADHGETAKGIADLDEAVRVAPGKGFPLRLRAAAWFDEGEYDKAIADLDAALRINGDDAEAYYWRGRSWQRKRELDKAVSDFDRTIRLKPDQATAYFHRGNALRDRGELAKAIADFSRAIQLDRQYAQAYQDRGNIHYDLGHHQQALEDYDRAIQVDAKYAFAYNGRGNARLALGRVEEAIEDLTTATRLDPNYAVAHYNLGRAWMKRDVERALRHYDEACRLDPDYTPVYYARGIAWRRQGDPRRAISDFNEAIRRDPKHRGAYAWRGFARYALADYAAAKDDFQRAVAIDPAFQAAIQQHLMGDEPYQAVDATQPVRLAPMPAEVTAVTALDVPRVSDRADAGLLGFSDDFARDSRDEYELQGGAAWKPGVVTLPAESMLSRRVRTGSPAELAVDLEFPAGQDDAAHVQTELVIFLRNGEYVYVVLRQQDSIGGIDVLHGHYDAGAKQHTREPVRQFRLKSRLPSGAWTVRYHYGLFQVLHAGVPLAVGYVGLGPRGYSGGWGAVACVQRSGAVRLRRMQVTAAAPAHTPGFEVKVDTMHNSARATELVSQARVADALAVLEQDYQLLQREYGREHPLTTAAFSMFAGTYSVTKDAKAIGYLDEALSRTAAVFGGEHPETADRLAETARIRTDFDGDATSVHLYERARGLYSRAFGARSPQVARVCEGIADLHRRSGNYEQSEKHYGQALIIYRRVAGEQGARTVGTTAKLGSLHAEHNQGEKAAECLAAVREHIADVNAGPGQQQEVYGDVWRLVRDLGAMSVRGRDYRSAEQFFQQALTIGKLLPNARQYALLNHIDLGMLNVEQDKYDDARRHLEAALAIGKSLYGEKSFNVTHIISAIGESYLLNEDYANARQYLDRAFNLELQLASDMLPVVSEVEALQFVVETQMTRNLLLRAIRGLPTASAEDAYRVVWNSQGLATRTLLRRKRFYPESDEAERELEKLRGVRKKLAQLAIARVPDSAAAARGQSLIDLSDQKEQLERKLARMSAAFRRLQQVEHGKIADLAERLDDNTAVVHLLKSQNPSNKSDVEYHAFVLARQTGDVPYVVRWAQLGDAQPIDQAVEEWRALIARKRGASVRGFAPLKPEVPLAAALPPQYRLRRLVWEPVERLLSGRTRVVIIPDGALTRLPWCALPGSKAGSYLLEQYSISTAGYGAQLLDMQERPDAESDRALVVGGVQYDQPAAAAGGEGPASTTRAAVRVGANRPKWAFLPGTLAEAKRVTELAGNSRTLTSLEGSAASEAALRFHLPRARFAHLATHGFFADAEFRSAFGGAGWSGDRLANSGIGGKLGTISGRNPLILSGVVLAGANLEPETSDAGLPIGDDGIMTAEEIADLDLRRMDLTVISACETGLGNIAGGEGVLGLQRAFHFAGARSVIASLWKVDDAATKELMERFYAGIWQQRAGKLESLREAQLWLLNEALQRGPDGKRGFDTLIAGQPASDDDRLPPYYWAAFVLSGDWR